MAIFYLNTIPLLPPLYLSLWCDLLLFKSLAISLCLLSQYWLYQQFIIYYITILLPITLFINYISKKKEFFSTPCKERRKKKFLLVQELSRTFLINTYSPSLVLFFLLFSLTANLCDVPLTGLLAASEVGDSFEKTRYQRFRSDWNLYGLWRRTHFHFRQPSKRALRAILLIVIIQVATTTVVICPESF